jgi:hypothetical protein
LGSWDSAAFGFDWDDDPITSMTCAFLNQLRRALYHALLEE